MLQEQSLCTTVSFSTVHRELATVQQARAKISFRASSRSWSRRVQSLSILIPNCHHPATQTAAQGTLRQHQGSASSRSMAETMKAVVIHEAGGPEVLKVERRPLPTPEPGWVLLQVKAFGLNRSEMFTRQGHSPSVKFPRILGIEACGIVVEAPGGEFKKGAVVATAMGGMGRQFEGGYAEYTCVPVGQVQEIQAKLPWDTLGATPEMLQTAYGSLFRALQLKSTDRLLIRGATTSVGLAATAMAKNHGSFVAATTRSSAREELLKQAGADQVIIDAGSVAGQAQEAGGFDKVLELIGTTTLEDSLKSTRSPGIVCMTGIVGGKWALDSFSPMDSIPTGVYLTAYSGGPNDFIDTPLAQLCDQIAGGSLKVQVGRVFGIDDIVEAHRCMEDNKAGGKIVVLT